jgi:hypothetical protein
MHRTKLWRLPWIAIFGSTTGSNRARPGRREALGRLSKRDTVVTTLDRLSSMRGVDFGRALAVPVLPVLLRGHELVNACRVRLGGFERVGVLEGLPVLYLHVRRATL